GSGIRSEARGVAGQVEDRQNNRKAEAARNGRGVSAAAGGKVRRTRHVPSRATVSLAGSLRHSAGGTVGVDTCIPRRATPRRLLPKHQLLLQLPATLFLLCVVPFERQSQRDGELLPARQASRRAPRVDHWRKNASFLRERLCHFYQLPRRNQSPT